MDNAEVAAVEKMWGLVFGTVSKVIEADARFGYTLIRKNITPSLEDIVNNLKMLGVILDMLMAENGDDYSCSRMLLNAKQQIVLVEQAAYALKYKNRLDYDQAMAGLKNQAQI